METEHVKKLFVLYDQFHYDLKTNQITIDYSKLYAYLVETSQIEFELLGYATFNIFDKNHYNINIVGKSSTRQFVFSHHTLNLKNTIEDFYFDNFDHNSFTYLIIHNDSKNPFESMT